MRRTSLRWSAWADGHAGALAFYGACSKEGLSHERGNVPLRYAARSTDVREGTEEMGRRLDLTEGELRALYVKQGLSTVEIARMFGVTRQAVSFRLQAAGIETRKPQRVEIPADRLRALYVDAKLSARTIALIYSTYPQRVLDLLNGHGIEVRPGQPVSVYGPKDIQTSVSCSEATRAEWDALAAHGDESHNAVFARAIHELFNSAFTAAGVLRRSIEDCIYSFHLQRTGRAGCPVCDGEVDRHNQGCPLGQLADLAT